MLQYIISKNERYNIEEQTKMALNAGCRWIELDFEDTPIENAKLIIEKIIPLCKETDAILIIDDYIDLVKELDITGVRLCKKNTTPADVRNILEGGPIIGVNVSSVGDIYALKGIDIDYVALGDFKTLGIDSYKKIVSEVRNAGIELPIVAYGDIYIEDIDNIMSTGVNGIAMSKAITNAENPTKYINSVLEKLYK